MDIDPQGVALHHVRLLRLRVQLDGGRPGLPRPGRAREGHALRRRRARPGDGRAPAVVLRGARHLGLHALLLLQRALPEGRRPARRDREARRRGDEGRHRLGHGREAREVVRHLGEDDRLAPRDGARAEDAGRRQVAEGGQVRDGPPQARQGAAAGPAARREARRRGARALRPREAAGPSRARRASCSPRRRSRALEFAARTASERDPYGEGSFPAPLPIPRSPRREDRRVLQGLPRLALGEGARHLDAGARAEGRARADRARGGDVLRRRRHPRGRARLLPPPERAHPRVRRGRRARTR